VVKIFDKKTMTQSQSHFTNDGQSVSQSVLALSPCMAHDHILHLWGITATVIFVVGRHLWREDGSVIHHLSCQLSLHNMNISLNIYKCTNYLS